ncbi:MAG: hypothetical protein COC09_08275 [Gammaproteobacteria bacterium]|nr:DUF721 domain-containing protein [Gammaproteobacteria bacterium]PCH62457.1 MAG: hypothetical protein COC09_08275 [Gammaproteobacteria bacterium]
MTTQTSRPRSIKQLLGTRKGGLSDLIAGASARMELTQHVTKYLPLAMHDHCWVTAINESELTIVTDSPAWASKLRYLSRDLIRKLKQETSLPNISFIKVKVSPNEIR